MAAAAALLLLGARHPMHTTVTEITCGAGTASADVTIRAFADDLSGVVPLSPGVPGSDSAMSRYVRERFAVADRNGKPAFLRWVGARRESDVVLLRLTVPAAALAGARITSTLLSERFSDQINIVRATCGGRVATLLFTPGDGPKVLP